MVVLLVSLAIAVIVALFLYWCVELLAPHLPFPANMNTLIVVFCRVVIAAVVLFNYVIPVLKMLPSALHL